MSVPGEYCGSLDCKWNILPEENAFIFAKLGGLFSTEKGYDILDVYQTRWNGSELMKVRQASVSGEAFVDVEVERLFHASSIGGGLFFHFVTDGHDHNRGFKISFTRYPKDDLYVYPTPCPEPFYYATNSTQYIPSTAVNNRQTCIFSINSTQAVKLIIRGFDSSENKIERPDSSNRSIISVSVSKNIVDIFRYFFPTGEVVQMTGEVAPMTGEVAPMTGEVVQMTGEVAPMTGEVVQMTGEVVQMTGEVAPMTGEVVQMTGEVVQMTGEVAPMTGEVVQMTGEVAPMTGKNLSTDNIGIGLEKIYRSIISVSISKNIEKIEKFIDR
uniref:CUB domain-containing protein n=1 Tax=Meloidogyne incognita TaxID=6306 RepID=A0A914N6Q3_MELIC